MRISENVSQVSTLATVRRAMVDQQRRMGQERGIVMDGRDIGTIVFPDAELKIFLTADIMVRAFRRQQELLEREELVEIDAIVENLTKGIKLTAPGPRARCGRRLMRSSSTRRILPLMRRWMTSFAPAISRMLGARK